jgi:hypothetical protein
MTSFIATLLRQGRKYDKIIMAILVAVTNTQLLSHVEEEIVFHSIGTEFESCSF